MTIKELIEKLETESDKKVKEGEKANGVHALLEHWYKNMWNCKDYKTMRIYDDRIFGILIGLSGAYFITESEFNDLEKETREYSDKCLKKIHGL